MSHDFIVVRRARVDDVESIMQIKRKGWLDTYPNKEFGFSIEDIRLRVEGHNGERIEEGIKNWTEGIKSEDGKERVSFVACINDQVVGFGSPRVVGEERRIGAMYVDPDIQRRGAGSELIKKCIDWLGRNEDIYVHVLSYNDKAISFYEKFGFKKTGRKIPDEILLADGKPMPEIEMILKANN